MARQKSDLERTELSKEKTGEFTGAMAINPVNGQKIPIWIADYVLASYGTGAIMAVPAHDQRDYDFAVKYNLPIIQVVKPADNSEVPQGVAYCESGIAVNSGELNGLPTVEAKKKICKILEDRGQGKAAVSYRLRDWIFSRQRYWGEPIPIVHCKKCGIVPVPEDQLPVTLPEVDRYEPSGTGESPLATIQEWLNTSCPSCGGPALRETNTMPQWAGSCWYYLRYLDPHNEKQAWAPEKEKYWMPVDLYVGGAEHAVLHLLYSRFWHKVLYKLGLVSHPEPWKRLIHQGMILGISYKNQRGVLIPNDQVVAKEGKYYHRENGEELTVLPAKMSKSLKNVVNPDDIIKTYGADAFRLYEMFMGPLREVKPWNTEGVEGVYRFLQRVWKLIIDPQNGEICAEICADSPLPPETERLLHQSIKKVTEDIESLSYNTAISQLMILVNELNRLPKRNRQAIETLVLLLSPLAPHIAEELWQRLGHTETLAYVPWPQFDPEKMTCADIEIVIQINGKPRVRLQIPAVADQMQMQELALADKKVQEQIAGRKILKCIAVPGRLVNVVVK